MLIGDLVEYLSVRDTKEFTDKDLVPVETSYVLEEQSVMPDDTTTWEPVTTLSDLDQLDDAAIQEGYFDGRDDTPEPQPGGNRSRAYWHGWHCGMMDTGRIEIGPTHRKLVADFLKRERLRSAK